ncbi:hypothetical protein EYZ11_009219 [Aspergillus tanneri]|uniref:Membrane-bound alpha-1,6-mannosyltransferase Initiation-specific n=1 Tax=Aspergillus tanneri TaxID=1220188 RepID=A0A4S3JAK7_9EURO|nr:uncharacterized protein ATNIH1004_000289 [Aspergillus tanneri]KAA8651407.1 hypothetical protein ATNIH1004_000289 [Aspergillus tanneri]THC91317.1 hypothetical protein EYZ11_009219 [Aspergillus tanneri]
MFIRRQRKLIVRTISSRRLFLFVLVIFVFALFYRLPSPPKTKQAGKTTPKYDVQDTPRFLYHSPFRDDPDLEYEERVSEALYDIEHIALQESGGDNVAQERIWQVMLGEHAAHQVRGKDSIAFEERNDEWKYSLVTTAKAIAFINDVFSTVPGLRDLYMSYSYDVLRADLLRYLLLWYHGGFYADLDVFPRKTIKDCPALEPLFSEDHKNNPNISLVLGIEIDEPKASPQLMRQWRWSRSYEFIQYTLYAPRRFSPILREAIVRTLSHTKKHIKKGNFIWGTRYNEKTILEVSGPGMFTDAVLDTLSRTLPSTHKLVDLSLSSDKGIGDLALKPTGSTQRRVTWAPFFGIRETLCVDASEATKDPMAANMRV